MFTIRKNEFFKDGTCKYKDEYGNCAYFKRTGDNSFEGSIEFINNKVKANPISVEIPIKEDQTGGYLHIDFASIESRNEESVVQGIAYFGKLIQHWINMFYEISNFGGLSPDSNNSANSASNSIAVLRYYDELRPFIDAIMESNYSGGMMVKK